jgi:CRISPR-associated protein Csb2
VLPRLEDTLWVGETARRCLQGVFGRLHAGAASPTLSGRAPDGSVMAGHRHCFYLPTDEDGDGKIDHLTLFARGCQGADGNDEGFQSDDLAALKGFTAMRNLGSKPDLRLTLEGLGEAGNLQQTLLVGPARIWRSVTPFIPPRHQKFRGTQRENPLDQLCAELERHGLPAAQAVRPLSQSSLCGRVLLWTDFQRQRLSGQGSRGQGFAYGFELEFAEAVSGPVALGFGCHFGLGLFVACCDLSRRR